MKEVMLLMVVRSLTYSLPTDYYNVLNIFGIPFWLGGIVDLLVRTSRLTLHTELLRIECLRTRVIVFDFKSFVKEPYYSFILFAYILI